MPAAARPAIQTRSRGVARRARRAIAQPRAHSHSAKARSRSAGLGQQLQRQAVGVGEVAIGATLAVIGEAEAALAGAGDRRFAELVEGDAPDVVARPATVP